MEDIVRLCSSENHITHRFQVFDWMRISKYKMYLASYELQDYKDLLKPQNKHHQKRHKKTSRTVSFSMERNYLFIG